jgi:hypothetical protein
MDGSCFRRYPRLHMPNRPPVRPSTPWDRFARSPVVRGLMVVILVPVLVLGAFGGTTFLAHSHGENDSHVHVSPASKGGSLCPEQHRLVHAPGAAECDGHHPNVDHGEMSDHGDFPRCADHPTPIEAPDGVLITIPDDEQLVPRGVGLAKTSQPSALFAVACAWLWNPPDVTEHLGSPGGWGGGPTSVTPLHLASLSTVNRLVRTSGALLL